MITNGALNEHETEFILWSTLIGHRIGEFKNRKIKKTHTEQHKPEMMFVHLHIEIIDYSPLISSSNV